MGLMDKVKAQATTLAQKTQETANAQMAKLDATQASRRSDAMLRSLGVAVLAERTGRATAETAGQIDKLITDLTAHESQHGVNLVTQAAQTVAMQTGPGDFLTSSPSPADASSTFSAAPPPDAPPAMFPSGAPQAYPQAGFPAGQSTGFPGAAPATSFPESAPASGFPDAAPATAFPEAAPATSFPQADPVAFPQADPVGFPQADPVAFPPDAEAHPAGEGTPSDAG